MISKNLTKWKILLTIANNFTSSIITIEERVMHSKSDNIKVRLRMKQMKL